MSEKTIHELDELDRKIVKESQAGLPLTLQPYETIAQRIGSSAEEVIERMQRMLESGAIRRIGVVPNHYTLGFRGNGMTVWDIPDDKVIEYGEKIGNLDFVSHAYQRPRHQPQWNYNLFAMVHGKDREEVMKKVEIIVELLGEDNRGHEVLFSSKILKKTGMRF